MSEKQEKKRRYNQKLEYIAHVEKWLKQEPPMLNYSVGQVEKEFS